MDAPDLMRRGESRDGNRARDSLQREEQQGLSSLGNADIRICLRPEPDMEAAGS